MDKNRPVGGDVDFQKLLEYTERLHHTDEDLARKVLRTILVERAQNSDFRDPSLNLQPENGVIHVSI